LAAKAMIPVETILSDINFGGEAKEAVTENYLAVQLACREHKLYYWESNSTAELDFVIMYGNGILPIECKANVHVRAKSLEIFKKKYDIAQSVRVSAKNFGMENGIKSVPLYAAWCI
jgi:predicted AAA+ superfamily ATPase